MRMLLPPPEKAHPALGPMYHERPTLRKEKSFVRFSDFLAPQRVEDGGRAPACETRCPRVLGALDGAARVLMRSTVRPRQDAAGARARVVESRTRRVGIGFPLRYPPASPRR